MKGGGGGALPFHTERAGFSFTAEAPIFSMKSTILLQSYENQILISAIVAGSGLSLNVSSKLIPHSHQKLSCLQSGVST